MAYARGRTIGSWGSLFGPWQVDSAFVPSVDDSAYVDQFVDEIAIDLDFAAPVPPVDPPGGGTVGAGVNPNPGIDLCGGEVPVVWINLTPPGSATTHRLSKVPINKGAPDKPWVQSFGTVRRALSNRSFDLRGTTVSARITDTERVLRGLERTDSLVNAVYEVMISTEAALRSDPTLARRIFSGLVTHAEPAPGLQFDLRASDFLQALLDQRPPRTYPQRRFTLADFPNLGNDPTDSSYAGPGPGNPELLNTPVPIGYGLLEAIPAPFVGRRVVQSFPWDEYILFGHAPTGGILTVSGAVGMERGDLLESMYGVDIVAPGHANWDSVTGSAAPYVDLNGHRYCRFLARGPVSDLAREGKIPFICRVGGVEDVGDGSGTLIDSLPLQILHLLNNWILQSYQAGAWLSIPTVNGYSRIKTDTFDTVKTVSEARVVGGWLGACWLGWNRQPFTLPDLIRWIGQSGLELGTNADGQLMLSIVHPSAALARAVYDVTDRFKSATLKESFRAQRKRDEIVNRIESRFQRRYATALTTITPEEGERLPGTLREPETEWLEDNRVTPPRSDPDTASLTKYGERLLDLPLELVRDEATHDDIVAIHLEVKETGPIIASYQETLCGTNTELGDRTELTHFEGVDEVGYQDEPMRCEAHTVDLDRFTVETEHLVLPVVA